MASRTRNWATIIYQESAKENFEEIIDSWHIKAVLSPLHKDDKNKDGAQKKAHWHLTLIFGSVKSRSQVKRLTDEINGVGQEPINDLRGQIRYLCHLDNPEKAQYQESEIKTFGGADYELLKSEESESEQQNISDFRRIFEIVNTLGENNFALVAEMILEKDPNLFGTFRKNSYFFASYLKSKKW